AGGRAESERLVHRRRRAGSGGVKPRYTGDDLGDHRTVPSEGETTAGVGEVAGLVAIAAGGVIEGHTNDSGAVVTAARHHAVAAAVRGCRRAQNQRDPKTHTLHCGAHCPLPFESRMRVMALRNDANVTITKT